MSFKVIGKGADRLTDGKEFTIDSGVICFC